MTPWKDDKERALNWVLSSNNFGRIPFDYTGKKLRLIKDYHIQRICGGNMYIVSWYNGATFFEKRMNLDAIVKWITKSGGDYAPNVSDDVNYLTINQITQIYGVTGSKVRNDLIKLDRDTITKHTYKAPGNHWRVSRKLANDLYNREITDKKVGRYQAVNLRIFERWSDDFERILAIPEIYNCNKADIKNYFYKYRQQLLDKQLARYDDNGVPYISCDLCFVKWGFRT